MLFCGQDGYLILGFLSRLQRRLCSFVCCFRGCDAAYQLIIDQADNLTRRTAANRSTASALFGVAGGTRDRDNTHPEQHSDAAQELPRGGQRREQ